jgi:hypothetical protein
MRLLELRHYSRSVEGNDYVGRISEWNLSDDFQMRTRQSLRIERFATRRQVQIIRKIQFSWMIADKMSFHNLAMRL